MSPKEAMFIAISGGWVMGFVLLSFSAGFTERKNIPMARICGLLAIVFMIVIPAALYNLYPQ